MWSISNFKISNKICMKITCYTNKIVNEYLINNKHINAIILIFFAKENFKVLIF